MNKIIALCKLVHIHALLWLIIALAVVTGHFIELSMLLLIIFVHEMGHAAAASFFSWRITRISLLPFGGVAEMEEHGNRPLKEEAVVVLAGPLQHIWLALLAFLFYKAAWLPEHWFWLFIDYNLMVVIFNLLPIWPLDGGKLVFLLLSLRDPFPLAHKRTLLASVIGIAIFTAIVLFTVPGNLNVWIVVGFLLFSLHGEWKQKQYVFMRFLLERHYGKNSEFRSLKPLKVNEEELIINVLERFQRGCKHPVIIEKNGKEQGLLDETELLHAYFSEKLLSARIGDLLYPY
ncbi:stage IV sporulation protein FB [Bacillus canaveralius]|uniref:Stage IV sporulation protein FB n=1 Tax=Bacillus canaveralius TaxID=1403243 RepID=A0A2N5GFM4_9BACI|nr:M50 family metallopeptidase [Bacillus canaveralius]PLR79546.1 stage IV sporulation protein FB [Bacillus canaveralius]PLR89795.1 stage IV sporulation protein FB [Bacillus canaveralius]RSK52429.1 stage IV sporulation protein FB [Bacillus canaveralius]